MDPQGNPEPIAHQDSGPVGHAIPATGDQVVDGQHDLRASAQSAVSIGSIVVPFWDYLIGS